MNPNWCETFFDGLALDLWRAAVTPETTRQEAAFILAQLKPAPGARLLDVPCGNGRHSIEVAKLGYDVTGLDISKGFHDEARALKSTVHWILGDMRRLEFDECFDGIWCWGNSFSYFPHEITCAFVQSIARALKPGGVFVLDTGAVIDSLLPVLQSDRLLHVGGIDFHSVNQYHPLDARLDTTYTFTKGDRREVKPISQWLHGAAELLRLLRHAGLHPAHTASGIDGQPYEHGSTRMIVTARRPDRDGHLF